MEKITAANGVTYTVEPAEPVPGALNPRRALVTMEMGGQVRKMIVHRYQDVKVTLAAARKAGLDPATHIEVYADKLHTAAPKGMIATPWTIMPREIAPMLDRAMEA